MLTMASLRAELIGDFPSHLLLKKNIYIYVVQLSKIFLPGAYVTQVIK